MLRNVFFAFYIVVIRDEYPGATLKECRRESSLPEVGGTTRPHYPRSRCKNR